MERRKKGGREIKNCKERRGKSGISKLALLNLCTRLEMEREKKTPTIC